MNQIQKSNKQKILILSGEDFWLAPMVVRQLRRSGFNVAHVRVKSFDHELTKGIKILTLFQIKDIVLILLSVVWNALFLSITSRAIDKLDHSILKQFDYTFMVNYPYKIVMDIYPGNLMNCHPSLLPDYSGLRPIPRMFEENAQSSLGATIHLLESTIDTGPIRFQKVVEAQNICTAYTRTYSTFIEGITAIIQTGAKE